jgi:hypothetical protein
MPPTGIPEAVVPIAVTVGVAIITMVPVGFGVLG